MELLRGSPSDLTGRSGREKRTYAFQKAYVHFTITESKVPFVTFSEMASDEPIATSSF